MTDLQKRAQEIAELRAKASKGPWTAVFDGWWGWEVRPYRPDIRPPYTASPVCRVELNEKVNKRNAAFIAAAHDMADLIAEQAAEIERLRMDAERYRWLRNDAVQANPLPPGRDMVWAVKGEGSHDHDPIQGAPLDDYIDSAIAERMA